MLNYVLSFVAVVNAGSFSLAAKNMHVSKAQLSRHVSQLEALLGIRLLHRTTRSLYLTEQGRKFFDSCTNIEEILEEAVNTIKHDFNALHGTLKITAPIDFGIQFLPSIIHQFSVEYPNINIIVALSNFNENLLETNYDLAIRIANTLPDSNLRMNKLMQFKRIICASPQYFKNKLLPKHPKELKNYRCITSLNRNLNIIKPQWQFYENEKILNYTLDNFIEVDSLYAQMELIKSNAGIGRLPDYFIRNELKKGTLTELFSHMQKANSYVYLLYPDIKVIPKKTRIFLEFLKDKFKNHE